MTPPDALQLISDGELGRALLAHHPDAAQEIWRRYAPMVQGFFNRAMGPDNDVEDMTHDVFVRFLQARSALREPERLRSYVFSIAVRMLKWQLRRRRVRRVVSLWQTGMLSDTACEVAIDDGSEARAVLALFHRLLEHLRAEERAAFVLRHIEGMSLEETAASMRVSLATAKRRIRRATDRVDALVAQDEVLSSYLAHHAQWRRGAA